GLKPPPLSVGVPLTVVAPVSVSPAGSTPPAWAAVYEPDPPITRRACEYVLPSVPFGRKLVCSSGDTFNGNVFVAVAPVKSVTVNCTLKDPVVASGVPHSSASPGVTQLLVTPSPVRKNMPAG